MSFLTICPICRVTMEEDEVLAHAQARSVSHPDCSVLIAAAVRPFGMLSNLTLIRNHTRAGDRTGSTARLIRANERRCEHGFPPGSASLGCHVATGGRQPWRPRPVRRSHLGSQDGSARDDRDELTPDDVRGLSREVRMHLIDVLTLRATP